MAEVIQWTANEANVQNINVKFSDLRDIYIYVCIAVIEQDFYRTVLQRAGWALPRPFSYLLFFSTIKKQTKGHIFWDCKLYEEQQATVMAILSENRKKEYPKSVTELLR
jgi:hypothetical protein